MTLYDLLLFLLLFFTAFCFFLFAFYLSWVSDHGAKFDSLALREEKGESVIENEEQYHIEERDKQLLP